MPAAARKDDEDVPRPTPERRHKKKRTEDITRPAVVAAMPHPVIDNPKARGVIIGALAMGSSIRTAASVCMAAGFEVSPSVIAERKALDPVFAEEIDNAVARNVAVLAMGMNDLALNATDEAVRVKATYILLKNLAPHQWRDRTELQVLVADMPGAIKASGERARARREALIEHLRATAVPGVVVGTRASVGQPLPLLAASGGNGNGNGHGE